MVKIGRGAWGYRRLWGKGGGVVDGGQEEEGACLLNFKDNGDVWLTCLIVFLNGRLFIAYYSIFA